MLQEWRCAQRKLSEPVWGTGTYRETECLNERGDGRCAVGAHDDLPPFSKAEGERGRYVDRRWTPWEARLGDEYGSEDRAPESFRSTGDALLGRPSVFVEFSCQEPFGLAE